MLLRPRVVQGKPLRRRSSVCLVVVFGLLLLLLVWGWTGSAPATVITTTKPHDWEAALPLERLDLTFYATTRSLGPAQLTAIRSWLALGADVIVFVDALPAGADEELPSTLLENGQDDPTRFKLLLTPLPRSVLGAPRLDLIMESGEAHAARTNWVCMINADIIVPTAFASLVTTAFADVDVMAIGERLDCRVNPALAGGIPRWVNSFDKLEQWSMAPCWPHGSGGKDFFLYRKGLFQRRKLAVPPFWIGKFVWDHWLVNSTREFAVDVTPSVLVGHMSHEYDWNWRVVRNRTLAKEQKALAQRDIQWNQLASACGNGMSVSVCLPFQSTYDVRYQLCPGGRIRPMPSHSRSKYFASIDRVRLAIKPAQEPERHLARRVYLNQSLLGQSPRYWEHQAMERWAKEHGCEEDGDGDEGAKAV